MSEVAICTESIVIPTLGAGMLFQGEGRQYLPEDFIQHITVCLTRLIHPLVRKGAFLDCNQS